MIVQERHLQPLSGEELAILVELLEAERRDLPAEIRRTREGGFHDRLQQRLRLVEGLLKRLSPVEPNAHE